MLGARAWSLDSPGSVFVDVITVRGVTVALVGIVVVVAMGHRLVTTARSVGVHMSCVTRVHDLVPIVVVALVGMMQVALMEMVRVLVVEDGGMAAVRPVSMGVVRMGSVADHDRSDPSWTCRSASCAMRATCSSSRL